ncbi:MAG: hypothetical protein KAR42_12390 [candidate division Zixibacteria bacterium]|nr:hypothetical protein [candidate division Zixibacteria bacterium]
MKKTTILFLIILAVSVNHKVMSDDDFPNAIPVENYNTGPGIMLRWFAPGDDGRTFGTAKEYDIRYWNSPLTPENWDKAYQLEGEPKPVAGGTFQAMFVYGLENIESYYFAMKAVDEVDNWSTLSHSVTGKVVEYICGDANGDGEVTLGDGVYLLNFIFKNGPWPQPLGSADANGNGYVEIGDVKHLINYVYTNGPLPMCGN